MSDRAVVLIDGNKWYHSLKENKIGEPGRLNYASICTKLVGPRKWLETRYYIGQVSQKESPELYASQRSFFSKIQAQDTRIKVCTGRLERRPYSNPASSELFAFLQSLRVRIDTSVYHQLVILAEKYSKSTVLVEKAVDVMLAVDMAVMAERDMYDAAYLLSADGDFTPAIIAARAKAKKVYAASCNSSGQLGKVCNSFIHLKPEWFSDCY
jgi:uncharacterized LabA/DUF88 family protein